MVNRIDVAKLAGVSPTTVSRVLNENGYVSEEVRSKVKKAIEELEYVPNRMGRNLRMQKSGQIACITNGLSNPFYSEIVLGIEEIALANDYTFSIYSSDLDKQQYNQLIMGGFYDGVIVLTPLTFLESIDPQKVREVVPISILWDQAGKTDIPNVRINLKQAMVKIMNHLLDNGHSEIVYLGEAEYGVEITQSERFNGYLETLKNRNISLSEEYLLDVPSWENDLIFACAKVKELLNKQVPFTAIAAFNDSMALGAMRALAESGLSVPGDISITGFDDIEISSMITPSLTTATLPKKAIGQSLMNILLRQIRGEQIDGTVVEYTADLVNRESVKNINQ
ncbi:putative transcriptional regulator [Bacillus sp. TS-2]|nr:putative transcriptional regulator [Bacillus sp. TS-2]